MPSRYFAPAQRVAALETHLIGAAAIQARGIGDRALAALVASGQLRRVHRGWYVDGATWQQLTFEEQHLARVIAVHRNGRAPVFSHISAAVLHGLPVYRLRDSPAHLVGARSAAGHRSSGVIRHRTDLADDDLSEVGGIACTGVDRTVFDLARTVRPEIAVTCADAALARCASEGGRIHESCVGDWRDRMLERAERVPGARGIRMLRRLVPVADPRSGSPLESVSRLQLHRLGFDLDLQVPVAGPAGSMYYVDFELLGLRVFGECDGKVKYADERMLRGRSAGEAVWDEKQREDWIRGTTDYRLVRWGDAHVQTPGDLGDRLRVFNVPLPLRRW